MHHLLALLLDALATGAVRIKYGRIAGRCGYVDEITRTVVLNPDASPEQLVAELGHDLAALIDQGPPPPSLRLIDGDRPDHAPAVPAPRTSVLDTENAGEVAGQQRRVAE